MFFKESKIFVSIILYVYNTANDKASGISSFNSGWLLKDGGRPGDGVTAPNGSYDGLYIEDYEYITSNSDLDEYKECFGVTPDYPDGTYYYVLTDNWPYISSCFNGSHTDEFFLVGPANICPTSTAPTQVTNLREDTGSTDLSTYYNTGGEIIGYKSKQATLKLSKKIVV